MKYQVTLKLVVEADEIDDIYDLEDIVYEEVDELMQMDLLSACEVEEVWDRFEKPEQFPMRGYPA